MTGYLNQISEPETPWSSLRDPYKSSPVGDVKNPMLHLRHDLEDWGNRLPLGIQERGKRERYRRGKASKII